MISCILLAAGFSSRFGSPKALAPVNGQILIEQLIFRLVPTQLAEIIVVLGAHVEEIKPHILNHKKVTSVYNKDYNLGQTSSFKTGVAAVSSHALGIMLLPIDFPFIAGATIDALVDCSLSTSPRILIPTYERKKGHPPIFDAGMRKVFNEMDVDTGVNAIEHKFESEIVLFPVDDRGILETFSTEEEFEALKKNHVFPSRGGL